MKGTILILISALALAKPEKVRVNRNGCPIDVTSTEALLPHENCNQYYQCVKGALVKQDCPGNLLFNPDTLVCDRHENVNCHREAKLTANREAVVNSNPKKATTVCAADGSDGKLVAHEHCNQFYQCWNGKPVAISCYGHLNYNPHLEICDWPDQVDCGARIIPESNNDADEAPIICASEGTEELLVAHRLCNKFYKCHDGKPISYKCPGDLLYNINAGYCDCADNVVCGEREVEGENDASENGSNASQENDNNSNVNDDPSEAPTICAREESDGILIAHENCQKFYKCANGIPKEFTCYGELLFDPSEGHCEWPGNVDCGDRIIPAVESEEDNNNGGSDNGAAESGSSENEDNDNGNNGNNENNGNGHDDPSQAPAICAADGSEGVFVAHENCNQFYVCVAGKPVSLTCPGILLFNPKSGDCDWPEKVQCGDRIIPAIESEEDNNGGSDNGAAESSSSENEDNDNGNNENNGNGQDDPSQAPVICAADGSEGVFVAHENCNQFYVCVAGKPVSLTCPGILLFDPKSGNCDWPEKVQCGDRIIPAVESEEDNNGGSDNGAAESGSSENEDNDNGNNGNNENNGNGHDDPSQAPAICAADGSEGVFVAHENCNQFYVCVAGKPVSLTCPGILLFNPKSGDCDWPEKVQCGDRIIPAIESEEDNNGGSDNGAAESGSSENEDNDNGNNENNGNGHDDPSQAPAICAADGSEGVFVAHENCNQFYVCVAGKPVSLTCPGILLFNPKSGDCDWPEKVQCGDRIIPAVESEEDNNGGSDNGTAESGSSENEDNDNGNNGNNENNGNGHDDPSQAPAICAADGSEGVFVAHENCNQFYVCVAGKPVSLTCPGILLFNPKSGDCDWPEKVQCGDRIIPAIESEEDNNGGSDNGAAESGSSENENNDNGNNENNGNGHDDPSQAPAICAADGSEGVFVAHENCNQFYVCVAGKPVSLTCPGILLFNSKSGDCDWPEKVQCGDRIIPAVESEEDNNNGGSDNGAAESGSSENEDNDNGNNGNNENNGNGHDDPSQAPAICAADGSEGVFVAHENCNQFYVCVAGKPVSLTCPGILLFNPKSGDCDWPERVQCGDRIIPAIESEEDNNGGSDNGAAESGSSENENNDNGNNENNGNGHDDPSQAPAICAADGSEGVFVAHENCNQFYVCVAGKPVSLTCPGILLFNSKSGDCDWPEKVQCGDRIIPAVESEEDNNGGSDNGAAESGSSENEDNDNGNNGNNENNGNGHDDPSQAPAICAADGSEGVFVAHENCNQFYVCVAGKPVSLTCPGILLFNPKSGDCDWPEKVQCGDRIIPAIESEEDNNGGSDNGAAESGSSENEDNDNGNNENNGNGHDDPSQAPAICAADGSEGVFVAHENCNQFYVCVAGKPVSLTCPGILLFNPKSGDCDWPEKVQCGDRIIPAVESEEDNNGGSDNGTAESGSSENEDNDNGNNGNNENNGNGHDDPSQAPAICAADGSEGVFVAHENCNQFYVCVAGKPVSLTCPGILLFNPKSGDCDWPEKVQCGDRIIPAIESEEDNNGGSDNGAAESGSSENEDNDNGNNENNGNGHDDPSQAPAICAADGSEGVFVAHENCNQFYVCVAGKPVSLTCSGILLFNPKSGDCDWPEKVQCGDRIIPAVESEEDNNGGSDNGAAESGSSENEDNDNGNNGNNENNGNGHDDPSQAPAICAADGSEGVFVAHENCNQFYVCVAGKPVSLTCSGILLFNPKSGDCDWPEKVQCGDRIIPAIESEEDNNGGSDNGAAESGSSENEDNDNGNNENNGNGHDDPSQAPAICAADGSEGVFVAHENCNQFYVCVAGKPVSLTCSGILLFNPKSGDCDWPEKVQCGDRIIPAVESEEDNNGGSDNGAAESGSSENEDNDNGNNGNNENNGNGHDDPSQAPAICAADGSEGVFVAHENCNQFYVCVEREPVTLDCPPELWYSPSIGHCDRKENVLCGDRFEPENESEENNSNESHVDFENGAVFVCAASNANSEFIAHRNCSKFYVCAKGISVILDCPLGLMYDAITEQCDWPANVNCSGRLVPEVENDSAISEIDDNSNEIVDNDDVTDDLLYGIDSGEAGKISLQEAAETACLTGLAGTLLPHDDCNKFYMCMQNRPLLLQCAETQLFSSEKKICDRLENVDCGSRSRSLAMSFNKHLESRKALRNES